MRIGRRYHLGIPILSVEGKLIGDESKRLWEAVTELIAVGERNIILDLSRTTWIDSAGIGVVVDCYKEVIRVGGELKLLHVLPRIKRVLDTMGFLKEVFTPLYDDESEVVASFNKPGRGGV